MAKREEQVVTVAPAAAPVVVSTGPSNTINTTIQKLKGDNYLPWKRQITILLKLKGLEKALEEDCPANIDMQAILIILEAMDDSHRLQVQAEETAKAMLANIERQYANRSLANKHRLLSGFLQTTKSSANTLNEHVGKLKEIRAALADMGEKYSEDFFQVILINSVGPEYGNVMEQWEMIHPCMKTTEFLLSLLKQKEEVIKSDQCSLIVNHKKKWNEMTVEEKKKYSSCKKCGVKGHWARECASTEPAKNEEKSKKTIFNMGSIKPHLKSKWVLDSGATHHMCNNKSWFTTLTLYDAPKEASVGNGDKIAIHGFGTIDVINRVGDRKLPGTLTNVSYIPSLATNLISVAVASRRGICTTFDNESCTMAKDGMTVAAGKLVDDLYVMNIDVSPANTQILLTSKVRDVNEWHRVLGHPGELRLKKLFDDDRMDIKKTGELAQCSECTAAKAKHSTHPERIYEDCNEVGDRVFVDLGFINNKEKSTYHYYLLCKDQWSKFIFVYIIENKSDVNKALMKLIADFEYGSGKQIRCIASDNGSEFVNRSNELLFAKEHIVHQVSAPYVPAQNGQIEREMRTVQEMTRTLLIQSGIQLTMTVLFEAIKTACYLKNRVPTSEGSTTPYEAFIGRRPNLSNLVEFGMKVQILENARATPKFGPKTIDGRIVGFTGRRNTYRVFVPKTGRVIETCDVYFGTNLNDKQEDRSNGDREIPEEGARISVDVSASESTEQLTLSSLFDDGNLTKHFHRLSSTPCDIGQTRNTLSQHATSPQQANHKPYCTGAALDEFFREQLEGEQSESTSETLRADVTVINNEPPPVLEPHVSQLDDEETITEGPPPLPPRNRSMFLVTDSIDNPKTFQEAIEGPNSAGWKRAISDELQAHEENHTWRVVERPTQGTTLSAKWVFTTKRLIDGSIERLKARLVARGFQQREGLDYDLIYAPVAPIDAIRVVLSLAAVFDWSILQFDVTTAFLHGNIKEDVYIEAPAGVTIDQGQCLKLDKALYGLKQAPRAWYCTFRDHLATIGLYQLQSEPCLFANEPATVIMIIYVDDALVVGKDEDECTRVVSKIEEKFKIKRLKGEIFVGIEIKRDESGIFLSQRRYTEDVLRRFHMTDAKGASGPVIDIDLLFEQTDPTPTSAPYREAIGSLMYLANSTRPDILYMVNTLASFNCSPSDCHWTAVKQILRYLKTTIDYEIKYQSDDKQINAFSDADYARRHAKRVSTSGVLVTLGGGPIIFSSRKQTATALSSTEAEYVAAASAARDVAYLNNLLTELKIVLPKPTLFVDNRSTIRQIINGESRRRSRHIEVSHHYVRESHSKGLFNIEYIESTKQVADLLTKPLGGVKLKNLIESSKIMTVNKSGVAAMCCMLLVNCLITPAVSAVGFSPPGFSPRVSEEVNIFQPHEPMIYLPTDYRVFTSLKLNRIHIAVESPCSKTQLSSVSPFETTGYTMTQELENYTLDAMEQLCQQQFEEKVLKAYDRLATCLPSHGRSPRTLPLLILGAVVFIVIAVSSVAYSYWAPGSSYNRLNDIDEKNRQRDADIAEFKKNLFDAKQVRAQTLVLAASNANKTQRNYEGIVHLAQTYPQRSWTISELALKMADQSKALSDIYDLCNEQKKFDFRAANGFAPSTNNTFGRMLSKDSLITDVVAGDGFTTFYVTAPVESIDTGVFEIATVPYYENTTTTPVAMEYFGPRYAIQNSTSNCMRGLREAPTSNSVYEKCDAEDWIDPAITDWRPARDPEVKPKVQRSPTESLIQCAYHNITVMGRQRLCPPWPTVLPHTISYSTPGYSWEVIHLDNFVKPPKMNFPQLKIIKVDRTDYDREVKLFNQVKEANDRSLKPGMLGYDKETLTIPLTWTTLMSVVGVISCCITVYMCIKKSLGSKVGESPAVNLTVTQTESIIPQAPTQSVPPRDYPVIQAGYYPSHYEEVTETNTPVKYVVLPNHNPRNARTLYQV